MTTGHLTTGHRLVLDPAGQVSIQPFDVPTPGPDQILVRTTVTQVSAGTEMNGVRRRRLASPGERATFEPAGLGYTAVGTVEAVGERITDYRVGERVLCNGNHASHWLITPGATADAASIPQQYYIDRLPDTVDDIEGCFAILGDVAIHGVRLAQLQIGESVAVHGLGVIGLLVVQLCRLSGAHPVVGVDLVADRLSMAQEMGAAHVVDAGADYVASEGADYVASEGADYVASEGADYVVAEIRRLTEHGWRWRGALPGLEPGAGADAQFHTTSYIGNYPDMIRAAADRGRIILIGATSGSVPVESQELFRREITVRGSYQTGMNDPHPYWPWSRARNRRIILDLIEREQLRVRPLVSHVVPFTDAPSLYNTMMDAGAGWLSVFFRWDE